MKFFNQELAIDLGTANTVIFQNGQIEDGIMKVLKTVPPEIYTDIIRNGIWLAGGGTLLRGIAKRLSDKMNLTFHVAEDPHKAVAKGTCKAIMVAQSYMPDQDIHVVTNLNDTGSDFDAIFRQPKSLPLTINT